MANFVNLILDTTAPANPNFTIDGGATFTTNELVTLAITTGDTPTTGYQMKIFGHVDEAHNTSIKATEATSQWIAFSASQQIKLSATGGTKTINVKIRDDVWNESSVVTKTINLDTTLPTVTVTALDVTKVSKISGKNVASFSFSVDEAVSEYKIKVVTSPSATHDTGTQIPTTNGSTNVGGTTVINANTPTVVTINGADLELASSGDGSKTIKCFVKDSVTGSWSV